MSDPDIVMRVAQWKQQIAEGKTPSDDEMLKAIQYLRQHRTQAAEAARSTKSPSGAKKTKGPTKSSTDLLDELGL